MIFSETKTPTKQILFSSLKGRQALVCGASQGIGQAMAQQLAQQGVRILALARNTSHLNSLLQTLPEPHLHQAIPQDLGDLEGLKKTIEHWLAKVGPIDILVNNTGGPAAGSLLEASTTHLQQAFQHHVLPAQTLSQLLVPGMKEKKFGRILNILSTSVKIPIPNLGVSNTIRAAMANWSKTLAHELGPYGITVNNILPGYTMTPRLLSLLTSVAQSSNKTTAEIEQQWKSTIPLGRFASPEEVAFAAVFLASTEASYINGINLPVDGGRTGCL